VEGGPIYSIEVGRFRVSKSLAFKVRTTVSGSQSTQADP
jgi:hypothetical protein